MNRKYVHVSQSWLEPGPATVNAFIYELGIRIPNESLKLYHTYIIYESCNMASRQVNHLRIGTLFVPLC